MNTIRYTAFPARVRISFIYVRTEGEGELVPGSHGFPEGLHVPPGRL